MKRNSLEMDDLPSRLRRETADLHAAVETATGLPGAIHSRSDYRELLYRLHGFHQAAELALAHPRWADDWAQLDIAPRQFRRSHLIENDLRDLLAPPPREAFPLTDLAGFPALLGCLYVVEGSALGGRVIGPAIRVTIGAVPTSFFESGGRRHPSPWRSLMEALRRFGRTGDAVAVVDGARATFRAFERYLALPRQDTPQ